MNNHSADWKNAFEVLKSFIHLSQKQISINYQTLKDYIHYSFRTTNRNFDTQLSVMF